LVGTDQLLGGPLLAPGRGRALAARTLVKGEPLTPPYTRTRLAALPMCKNNSVQFLP
jgi:hypothetical protein